MCLQWLDGTPLRGSARAWITAAAAGVLAIAALKLGARRAYAFDIDPQALLATRENAADNAVAERLQLCERAADIPRGCDVLLANILAEVLISLQPQFAQLLRARARAAAGRHSGASGSGSGERVPEVV